MAGPPPLVAAVVVTYNSEDAIAGCLRALAEFGANPQAGDIRVIVVDNASTDGTVTTARALGAEVIANTGNRGFAGAANQGFAAAVGSPFVLLMNPDVYLRSALEPLRVAAEEHGLAGGRLTTLDGLTQAGFTIRRFPTVTVLAFELLGINWLWPRNPANRGYRYLDRDLTKPGPADQPAGAFLMIRRSVWEQLGGLSESFWPIWFEDVDFCRRAAAAGHRAWFVPEVSASHLGGHSIRKINGADRQLYWYDSLVRYARLHFGTSAARFLCVAGAIGAVPRALTGIVQERSLRPLRNFLTNLNFLGRLLVTPHRPEHHSERKHAR